MPNGKNPVHFPKGVGCLDSAANILELSSLSPYLSPLFVCNLLFNSLLVKDPIFSLKTNPESKHDQREECMVSLSISGLARSSSSWVLSWNVIHHLIALWAGGLNWPKASPGPKRWVFNLSRPGGGVALTSPESGHLMATSS